MRGLGATRWIASRLFAVFFILAASTAAVAAPARDKTQRACCHVAAGTLVSVELVDQVSSAVQKTGDTFALRLAAPLVVHGQVVLRTGTPGVGEVIYSAGPEIGGKPAKMVLAASYLRTRRGRIPLDALQLARPGHDRASASQLTGLSGMVFAPLQIVGIVVPGGEVVFRSGTVATAKLATAVTLPPQGHASPRDLAAVSAAGDAGLETSGQIALTPPPRGEGQVVFFRARSPLGIGRWFTVRESGKALGKLGNGSYFIQVATPGLHTYTTRLEPELKDHLTLKVDAGETYFVEGALTGGLVLGAADLLPSSPERFEKAAKDLKPAGPPTTAQDRTGAPPS